MGAGVSGANSAVAQGGAGTYSSILRRLNIKRKGANNSFPRIASTLILAIVYFTVVSGP